MISVVLRSGETAAYETNRSRAAVRVIACASGKAGVVQPSIGVALIATSKSRHAVGPGVVVTVSPKHPLSLGSVYAVVGPHSTPVGWLPDHRIVHGDALTILLAVMPPNAISPAA